MPSSCFHSLRRCRYRGIVYMYINVYAYTHMLLHACTLIDGFEVPFRSRADVIGHRIKGGHYVGLQSYKVDLGLTELTRI